MTRCRRSHRYIIDFRDWPLLEAEKYPDPLSIVERLVRPERERQKDKIAREKWWLHMRAQGQHVLKD